MLYKDGVAVMLQSHTFKNLRFQLASRAREENNIRKRNRSQSRSQREGKNEWLKHSKINEEKCTDARNVMKRR